MAEKGFTSVAAARRAGRSRSEKKAAAARRNGAKSKGGKGKRGKRTGRPAIEQLIVGFVRVLNNGCWHWTGDYGKTSRVPRRSYKHKKINVRHVVADLSRWAAHPEHTLHKVRLGCGNEKCVRPTHMILLLRHPDSTVRLPWTPTKSMESLIRLSRECDKCGGAMRVRINDDDPWYCPKCRDRRRRAYERQRNGGTTRRTDVSEPGSQPCYVCGQGFKPKAPHQKYCGYRCREAFTQYHSGLKQPREVALLNAANRVLLSEVRRKAKRK